MRIALYSHDALGLGHLRRNLVIAAAPGLIPINGADGGHGDPRVYAVVRECGLGDAVVQRARYTGDLGAGRAAVPATDDPEVDLPNGRVALCLVGGGQDGFAVADAFATAPMPADTTGVVLTGPVRSSAVTGWLERPSREPLRPQDPIALDGLERLPGLLVDAVSDTSAHDKELVA